MSPTVTGALVALAAALCTAVIVAVDSVTNLLAECPL